MSIKSARSRNIIVSSPALIPMDPDGIKLDDGTIDASDAHNRVVVVAVSR
jgi:hypothetical protein